MTAALFSRPMARRKPKSAAPAQPERKRISVTIDGFDEQLARVAKLVDREQAELGRIALKALCEMVERDGSLTTPLHVKPVKDGDNPTL